MKYRMGCGEPLMSVNYERLQKTIERHEGKVLKPYYDSEGILTIGVGRNLEKGIRDDECSMMLMNDIHDAIKEAGGFWWFDSLDAVRQEVVVNMIFNLGLTRFKGFKKTISAIEERNWDLASKEMLDSKWAKQVGIRAIELSQAMKTGVMK